MSNLRNSVQLIGHLGADPEFKTLESGAKLAQIRIATTEHFKNAQGEWQDDTQWHNCTAWEQLAQRAKDYLKKGSYVLLTGRLTYRTYEDGQGVKKFYTEIRVSNFILLDKKPQDQLETSATGAPQIPEDTSDEGLPF